jgi:hypothetical protein
MRLALLTGLVALAATTGAVATNGDAAHHRVVIRDAKVDGHGVKWWADRARDNGAAWRWQRKRVRALERELRPVRESTVEAISYVFGPYAGQALRVAWCESRYLTTATNGQYLGAFQMGSSERAKYGHGWNAWAQAVSAYRYFADSGFDWSPWECKP